ncbi:hypothetical protein [Salicola sp. Rm-C-2C1-2]|uniref:hypothetical protein n=1 Tax=Salicola sp. Rm-C-2C1-2 TaxID=3141321 RepID=UPI0032E486BA
MSQPPTSLLPELQASIGACIETALVLHATTMPQIRHVMAGDAVIEDYVRTLGFGDRLVPWQHLGSDGVADPDLILAHQIAGGTSLCPTWLPARYEPRLSLVQAAQTPGEVQSNLKRIARVLGNTMGEMVPAQRFRETFEGLRERLHISGPCVLVLVETGRGRYRLAGHNHPCHTLFAQLGWSSAPSDRIAGEKISPRTLDKLNYDAVLILEAWPGEAGEHALERHWPLMLSLASETERWARMPVMELMCLGPSLPERLADLASRFQALKPGI